MTHERAMAQWLEISSNLCSRVVFCIVSTYYVSSRIMLLNYKNITVQPYDKVISLTVWHLSYNLACTFLVILCCKMCKKSLVLNVTCVLGEEFNTNICAMLCGKYCRFLIEQNLWPFWGICVRIWDSSLNPGWIWTGKHSWRLIACLCQMPMRVMTCCSPSSFILSVDWCPVWSVQLLRALNT